MNAIDTSERNAGPKTQSKDSIIRFEEGLIGFSECKDFLLMETEDLTPFRLLQCVDSSEVGFLVLDPALVAENYHSSIPAREWESIGLVDPAKRLAFAIIVVGRSPNATTGNFQAPLLVNYERMIGKQVILTDSEFSVRQPLI